MHRSKHYRGGYQVAGLSGAAKLFRRQATAAEALLWSRLRGRQLGVKFRRQHQFGDYVADFYCHEALLVVECDGQVHEQNEQWQHDQARYAYMVGQGLRVLRFPNEQVLNEIEQTIAEISRWLPKRQVEMN